MRERTPRKYPPEFKADAVAMVRRSTRPLTAIAAELGVNHWTLRDWYRADMTTRKQRKGAEEAPAAASETDTEKAARLEREVEKLRKKVAQLEEDRVILKKAAAFFARENE